MITYLRYINRGTSIHTGRQRDTYKDTKKREITITNNKQTRKQVVRHNFFPNLTNLRFLSNNPFSVSLRLPVFSVYYQVPFPAIFPSLVIIYSSLSSLLINHSCTIIKEDWSAIIRRKYFTRARNNSDKNNSNRQTDTYKAITAIIKINGRS